VRQHTQARAHVCRRQPPGARGTVAARLTRARQAAAYSARARYAAHFRPCPRLRQCGRKYARPRRHARARRGRCRRRGGAAGSVAVRTARRVIWRRLLQRRWMFVVARRLEMEEWVDRPHSSDHWLDQACSRHRWCVCRCGKGGGLQAGVQKGKCGVCTCSVWWQVGRQERVEDIGGRCAGSVAVNVVWAGV